jgi:SAM-dependent methyltransferase
MHLRAGIPLIAEVDALMNDELFRQHSEYNRSFLQRHGPALRGYGSHWGQDPLRLWSRRWEYPFAGQRLSEFARAQQQPVRILDAGSGVTYFDYMLCESLPGTSIICADSDCSYDRMFTAINRQVPGSRVSFVQAMLQSLPMESHSVDAICCISVLEHTDRYEEILDEFSRVLRPDGLFVLTFDLSLDGRFELSRSDAMSLLDSIQRRFAPRDLEPARELERMDQPQAILSTDHVKRTQPQLLPWRYPLLKGLHDLVKGRGWTGGFRSKSVYCMEAVKK